MARHREVTYDYTFDEQARLLEKDVARLDEIIRSAEWRIANHAETCEVVPGTILRVVFTDPFPDAPAMKIFFSIKDDNECVAHWIEHLDSAGQEEDDYDEDIPF